jgi:hypothetical protein
VLCHFQNPAGPEQLEQVADRAHQLPLVADIVVATLAEAAKTALFVDLSEDRLDDRLAHLVHGADGLGVDADDAGELADDHPLGGVVDELDSGDFADFWGGARDDDVLGKYY